jgi:hypothetical protein
MSRVGREYFQNLPQLGVHGRACTFVQYIGGSRKCWFSMSMLGSFLFCIAYEICARMSGSSFAALSCIGVYKIAEAYI